jgi:hypothetical protein
VRVGVGEPGLLDLLGLVSREDSSVPRFVAHPEVPVERREQARLVVFPRGHQPANENELGEI